MGSETGPMNGSSELANLIMFGGPTGWSEAWYSRHQLTAGLARKHRVVLVSRAPAIREALASPTSLFAPSRLEAEPAIGTHRYAHPGYLPTILRLPKLQRAIEHRRAQSLLRRLGDPEGRRSVVYVWHPEHADEVGPFAHLPIVYHAYDRYDLYTGSAGDEALRRERWLARHATFCVGASAMIVEHLKSLGAREVHLLRHGVDPGFFEPERAIPAALAALPRPRIGLVASLSDAIDYVALREIARSRPNWSLVVLGKKAFTDDRKTAQFAALEQEPNVHYFGFQPQKDIPAWLSGLDVALVSYDLETWAPFNQPLKLYEYLACGIAVVASEIQAATELGDLVLTVRERSAWTATIERALASNDEANRERRRRFADENRWERRVAALEDLLVKALSDRQTRPRAGSTQRGT